MPAGLDGNRDPLVSEARTAVISHAADHIIAQRQPEIPLLVAIDGIDGSGKSTFADELATNLAARPGDHHIVRATIDSFHNPRAERYRRGKGSGAGFYFDSHNLKELRARLLDPFRTGLGAEYTTACFDEPSDQAVDPESKTLAGNEVLLFDGIFACRPELEGYWDYVIHLDGRARVNLGRLGVVMADAPQQPEALVDHVLTWVQRMDRYTSGMAIYLDSDRPTERADLVIDNNDLANPRVVSSRQPKDTITPRLASFYDQEATIRAARGVDPVRAQWREDFIDRCRTNGLDRVLEVGSGPGRDTHYLAEQGIGVTALDLSLEAMILVGATGIPAINGSLYELPVRDASFDAGWSMSTLVHVPDARFHEAMAEICRTLTPGAPLGIGLWGGLDREGVSTLGPMGTPRFFSFRSHDRVRTMLEQHGTIELFETMDFETPDGSVYQFIILAT